MNEEDKVIIKLEICGLEMTIGVYNDFRPLTSDDIDAIPGEIIKVARNSPIRNGRFRNPSSLLNEAMDNLDMRYVYIEPSYSFKIEPPKVQDVYEWLSEHEQARKDAESYFGKKLFEIFEYEDLLDWISIHKVLWEDFKTAFPEEAKWFISEYGESEEIALKSGYYFKLFSSAVATMNLTLEGTVVVDGEEYPLYAGKTVDDARKIDELYGDCMGLSIEEHLKGGENSDY